MKVRLSIHRAALRAARQVDKAVALRHGNENISSLSIRPQKLTMREASMIPGPEGLPPPLTVGAAVRRLLRSEVGKKLYLPGPLCDDKVAKLSDAKEPEDMAFAIVRLLNARLRAVQNENWKPRDASIRFAVGQFYRHRRFGYRAVVIGFHPKCEQSSEWQEQMGISKLERGAEQPFYHSLVDSRDRNGAQLTYVAEENVAPCSLEDFEFPGHEQHLQNPVKILFFSIQESTSSKSLGWTLSWHRPVKILARYVLTSEEARTAYPDDAYVADVLFEFSQ